MKLLRFAIFVALAYQVPFFNLLSMEDDIEIPENKVVEENNFQQENLIRQSSTLNQSNIIISENISDPKTLRFLSQDDDTSIYKGDCFIGELPSESKHIIESLQNFHLIRNMFPVLIQVSGPKFFGKTTLVHYIVKQINCTKSQFLEIGSLNDIDTIKETLKSKGIVLNQLPSEIIKTSIKDESNKANKKNKIRKDIEAIIMAFYRQKAIKRQPYIINFTKGLKLNDVGLAKLRIIIKEIQQEKIAPLTVFFESRRNGSSNSRDFLDEIIHIYPPSPNDIMAILTYTFKSNGYGCEAIKPEILTKLKSAVTKKQYSPPYITRLAEKVLRNVAMKKEKIVTNSDIEKVLNSKNLL